MTRIIIALVFLGLVASPLAVSAQAEELRDNIEAMRIPPQMPWEAERSGYCCMQYDVDQNGMTQNIKTNFCTEFMFARPSIESMQRWRYSVKEGHSGTLEHNSIRTYITFVLQDEDGHYIPTANGMSLQDLREKKRICGEFIS